MFKLKSCPKETYDKICKFTYSKGEYLQENRYFCGVLVAAYQPNMLSDGPDFYWCIPFLKKC